MRSIVAGLGVAIGLLLGGCQKPVFPEDQPRSQYERYNSLRGRDTATTQLDAFGRERPNLRERMRPLE